MEDDRIIDFISYNIEKIRSVADKGNGYLITDICSNRKFTFVVGPADGVDVIHHDGGAVQGGTRSIGYLARYFDEFGWWCRDRLGNFLGFEHDGHVDNGVIKRLVNKTGF